ncbi:hypothetical protein [Kingella sp. (in: b-proteobacteria)]|nr:hypothetical protein [Kingella sp. (in: b-proteobacteria)]MDO4656549.1 hypothetical protein [Kingella sp. (in: b-proteobacteria)]
MERRRLVAKPQASHKPIFRLPHPPLHKQPENHPLTHTHSKTQP